MERRKERSKTAVGRLGAETLSFIRTLEKQYPRGTKLPNNKAGQVIEMILKDLEEKGGARDDRKKNSRGNRAKRKDI